MTEWRPELDAELTKKADSIAKVLRSRGSLMSPYNAAYLERVVAWNHSDFNAAYLAGRRLRGIAPHSDFARYVAARSAIPVNRMHEAADSLEAMEKRSSVAGRDARFYDDLTLALHRLGSHDRELDAARRAIRRFPQRNLPLYNELRALAALGRADECIGKAEAFLALPADAQVDPAGGVATIAVELLWHGKSAEARTLGRRALEVWRSGTSRASAMALVNAALLNDDFAAANEILRSVGKDSNRVVVVTLRGVVAARQGNVALARALSGKLEAIRGASLYAAPLFGRARIAAALGRRDEAIELYRAAIAAGLDFTFSPHPTIEFAPYAQSPALVALMRSKD
jgi:tetratricopeptide (TPR) repeat protein